MTAAEPGATISDDVIRYSVRDGVAWLTLDRPTRGNAWTMAMDDQCTAALELAAKDPAVRVVVITGAGRQFCVGAEVEFLDELVNGVEPMEVLGDRLQPRTDPRRVSKPVIAAINGSAAGIGLSLALMADMRICASSAKFTTAYARRGLVAEHGEAWLLPRTVGLSHAADLLLSARVISAEHALRIGLVSEVVPPEQFEETIRAYAADLVENCSPFAMSAIKRQLDTDLVGTLVESLGRADEEIRGSLRQPDVMEGVRSFVEKRSPAFPPLDQSAAR